MSATVMMVPSQVKTSSLQTTFGLSTCCQSHWKFSNTWYRFRWILDHLKQSDILVPEQLRFHAVHWSTCHPCVLWRPFQSRQLTGTNCIVIFLDLEKPFNSVWHCGLLYKLIEILLLDLYVHLITSFLRNRTFCVKVESALSQKEQLLLVTLRALSEVPCFSLCTSTTCSSSLKPS